LCREVEFDPLYADVIVRRYEAATGNSAALVETGEAFDVLERAAANLNRLGIPESGVL
jgi:hypothetical protein